MTGRMTRQGDGRLKAEFRLWDVATGQQLAGQQYFTSPEYWRRIAHIISDQIYERLTGEKGYFDSRVVFVDETGAKRASRQAPRLDGSGRRQRALSDARRRPRADAALLAVDPGNHLHGIRPGRSAGLSVQHRDRAARNRRQLPRHVVLAAFFARRPAHHHEPAAGRQLEPVRDGSALEVDHASDRHAGDRHLAVLFARRRAHLFRVRSRRQAANLCDGGDRRGRAAHLVRRGHATRRRSGRRAAITSPSPSRAADSFPSAS